MTPLEKIIRPIVEGQIRGFIKEHPSILKGVDWYKPRTDPAVTLTNSLAKRIVLDLTCGNTAARLAAALLECPTGTPGNSELAQGLEWKEAGVGERSAPASPPLASET